MVKINNESRIIGIKRAAKFESRVKELMANNHIIGKESTLSDVLALFKEFAVDDSDLGKIIKTDVINRVLGGQSTC